MADSRIALIPLGVLLLTGGAGCTFVTSQPGCDTNVPTAGSSNGGHPGSNAGGPATSGGGGAAGAEDVPMGSWLNVTNNLAGKDSACGTLTMLAAKPDEDLVIAGVATQGLWASTNGGDSWKQFGDSHAITNRPTQLVYDPAHPEQFWEAGIYGDGVYLTEDDGAHFVKQGTVQHVDSISIDFSDRKRQLILAGGHETDKTLYRTTDGGGTWTPIGAGLPAGTFCTNPLIIDADTYLVGCATFGAGTGIYRSLDSGKTWKSVSKSGGVTMPLQTSDGTIYWTANFDGGFVRSTDSGETWSEPMQSGKTVPLTFLELPDHRIAAVGTDAIIVSADHGDTWQPVTTAPPFKATTFAYSAQRRAFFLGHLECGNGTPIVPVSADAIARYDLE